MSKGPDNHRLFLSKQNTPRTVSWPIKLTVLRYRKKRNKFFLLRINAFTRSIAFTHLSEFESRHKFSTNWLLSEQTTRIFLSVQSRVGNLSKEFVCNVWSWRVEFHKDVDCNSSNIVWNCRIYISGKIDDSFSLTIVCECEMFGLDFGLLAKTQK